MTEPIQPNQPAVTGTSHHQEPGDEEVVYFDGRPQLRADQAKLALWMLIAIALIALPIAAWFFEWNWWRWPMTIVAVVLALLIVAIPWLRLRATRYRITNYRIDFERGILKKQIDTLELWHVEDIHFEQGLVDRMFNVGSIIVMSNDKTTPRLELHGVPRPREIFDSLKQRVIAVKRQRGVLKLDAGT
jgi:membrane protein YdbS with pleckstrin-like domain